MLQDVCNEVGLTEPTSVVTATDRVAKQLLATTHRVLNDLQQYKWPQLARETSITLVSGTASYALPSDFDSRIIEAPWNRDNTWPLYGPISAEEWQYSKALGNASTFPQQFRLKGYATAQLFIDPTPSTSEAGQTLYYEYQSKNIVRPKLWEASDIYSAGAYTFYDGNYYQTSLGGTTGSTAPTHTAGSVSDGAVTWTFFSDPYPQFLADTDECLIDQALLGLGVQWNYLASKGLPYQHLKEKYDNDVKSTIPKFAGAKTLYLAKRLPVTRGLNVPETIPT